MARPMTHTQFTDLMKEWGIGTVDNSRGGVKWYNHNRNSKGKWDAVFGIGNHHTGGFENKSGRDVLWNGYAGLPGPLCHVGIMSGAVLLNGWGRTNHFGLGDDETLQHVIHEDYKGILKPNEANTDGNRHFYGLEYMYPGDVKMPDEMYKTGVRVNAAICTFHKWGSLSSIGHGEWQPGKWDPGYSRGKMIAMDTFRNHVEQAIKEGHKPKLPSRPKPTPARIHTVLKGETLSGIAKKYGVTLEKLITDNPGLLQPGEKLTIKK